MLMREKKKYKVITFHTTTEAMNMEKCCGEHQIPGRLIPVPGEIAAGCGLAWRMTVAEHAQYEQEMADMGMRFEAVTELLI